MPVNDAITALEDIIRKDWAHMDEDWQKKAKVKLQAIQIALATATKVDATSVQKQRADLADEMFADLLRMKARLDGEHALVIDGAESSE